MFQYGKINLNFMQYKGKNDLKNLKSSLWEKGMMTDDCTVPRAPLVERDAYLVLVRSLVLFPDQSISKIPWVPCHLGKLVCHKMTVTAVN
jgi:hypothetical protein